MMKMKEYLYALTPTLMMKMKEYLCDNANLNDEKFRWENGIHLTKHGISVLATNLKYKIAEVLNVKVVEKDKRKHYNYRDEGWE